MNPKPLLALNHFTVPCSFNCVSLFDLSYLCLSTFPETKKEGLQVWTCSPFHNPKVYKSNKRTRIIARFVLFVQ
jgi:hypothetical protein